MTYSNSIILGSYGGVFWLHNNQLSGVIPESICNLSSYLLDNPDIHGIFLKLNNNQLCPPYSECIGRYAIGTQGTSFDNGDGGWENCDSCSTVELWEIPCSQCTNGDGGNEWNTCNTELPPSPTSGLNGEIPDVISEFTELRAIIMFDKQLVGEIPEWIGDLKSLREINLGNNQLTGAIPPEIFNLAWIQDLDLKNNQLTGKLPDNIGNLGSESSYPLSNGIDLRNNQLKGNIPESFPWYPCFSLSENNFISVPDDVCVFWPPPYECGVFGYYNQFHNNQLCEGSYPGCIYVGTQDTSECVDDCPPDSYSCSQWDGNEYRCDNVVESQNNGCFYCDPNDLTNDETYDNHCNPANINQCVCMSSTYGCCYTGGPPSYDPGTWCRIDEDCRSGTICCAGKCELDGACGDRDGNGIINVLDIVVLADYILYDSCNELDYACATDLNEDTFFNVLDLVTLANCILAGNCGG